MTNTNQGDSPTTPEDVNIVSGTSEVVNETGKAEVSNAELEMIKLFYDFKSKSIMETANTVTRGLPIYFTILGVFCAYFMTQQIALGIIKYIVLIVITISIGGLIVYTLFIRGILIGLDELKATFRLGGEQIFGNSKMDTFISRGKSAILSFLIVLYIVTIVVCIGFIRYLFIYTSNQ